MSTSSATRSSSGSASNDVDRLTETLDATQNRFDVGEVTRTDVSQSESRLAASRSTLAGGRGRARDLAAGLPGRRSARCRATSSRRRRCRRCRRRSTTATAIGIQRNPLIISAQFAERSAVYDFDRALAAKGPTVGLNASGGFERGNNQHGGPYDGNTFAQAGISASMPLYTGGRNDSLVRQAQDVLDQRRYELQDTGRTVTQAVAQAWTQLDVARATIVARREQAEAARIAAEGVAEEARLGARSTLDVLDADQERLQAEARDRPGAARRVCRGLCAPAGDGAAHGRAPEARHRDLRSGRRTSRKVRNGPIGGYDTSAVDRIRARWERN